MLLFQALVITHQHTEAESNLPGLYLLTVREPSVHCQNSPVITVSVILAQYRPAQRRNDKYSSLLI